MSQVNWFAGCSDINEIKKLYHKLAMRWHPDRPGGDTATMQVINAQYHAALKGQHGKFVKTNDKAAGSEEKQGFTYYYNAAREQAIMDKITEVIQSGILDKGVEVYLIGSWLWATGDTKPHRKTLGSEGLKFCWHAKRLAWYWHLPTKRPTRYNSNASLDDLAAVYGAERVVGKGKAQEEEKKALHPA